MKWSTLKTLYFCELLRLPISPILKIQKFLWVFWFLGKNLSKFIPPVWKLHNPYFHRLNKQGYRTYRRNYLRLTWVPGSKYFWHIKAKCSWRIPTDPFEVLPKFVKEFRLEKIDGFEALQGFLLLLWQNSDRKTDKILKVETFYLHMVFFNFSDQNYAYGSGILPVGSPLIKASGLTYSLVWF